jgi:hypothetical protein
MRDSHPLDRMGAWLLIGLGVPLLAAAVVGLVGGIWRMDLVPIIESLGFGALFGFGVWRGVQQLRRSSDSGP